MAKGRIIPALVVSCMILSSATTLVESVAAQVFQNVTDVAGVGNIGRGGGAAFGDYDGDGDLDLYLANRGANVLYKNNGDGTFSDVTKEAGVQDAGQGMDAVFMDYDNDGDLDIYVGNWGPNILYENDGNGKFSDVTRQARVGDPGNTWSVVAFDYDMDGWLDIYTGNGSGSGPNTLYHNEQNGVFSDVTEEAGVGDTRDSIGVCIADYDNDGDPDIYVGNWGGGQPDALYRNEGNGEFTDVARKAGVADLSNPNATIFLDYDNDGNMDLFLANELEPDVLYHNEGDGTFSDVSEEAGIEGMRTGFGAVAADYDNDGDLDIYVVNVGVNVFYENNGDGKFTEIAEELGVVEGGEGQAAAFADYDNDGDMDLYVVNGFGQNQQNTLYQNTLRHYNWLYIKLTGVKSNRNGIGARITVRSGLLHQTREVVGGSGYASQNTLFAEFGLRGEPMAEEVRIQWPSGQVDVLTDVPANQAIGVVEGMPGYQRLYVGLNFAVKPEGKYLTTMGQIKRTILHQNYPNPFNPDTWIPYQLSEDTDVTVNIHSISGQLIRTLNLGYKSAGSYIDKVEAGHWDGTNESGESVASGIYFYTIQAGDYTTTKKMTVMR